MVSFILFCSLEVSLLKDREQKLGLVAAGLLLLSGCAPTEKQVKKIDLGEVEITQLSPHAYKMHTSLSWKLQREPVFQRALSFLKDRCNIEYPNTDDDKQPEIVVMSEPNCVPELR